jgi:hypothetical protein
MLQCRNASRKHNTPGGARSRRAREKDHDVFLAVDLALGRASTAKGPSRLNVFLQSRIHCIPSFVHFDQFEVEK